MVGKGSGIEALRRRSKRDNDKTSKSIRLGDPKGVMEKMDLNGGVALIIGRQGQSRKC